MDLFYRENTVLSDPAKVDALFASAAPWQNDVKEIP
jgi:hypothetical protein